MTDNDVNKDLLTPEDSVECPTPPDDFDPLVCSIQEPFVRIAKRGTVSTRHRVMVYVIGFLLALIVGGLLLVEIGRAACRERV